MLPPLPFPKADRMEVTTVANNMIRLDQYGEVFTAATGNSSAGLGRVSTIVTREEAMNLSKKLCALALGALLLISGTVAARDYPHEHIVELMGEVGESRDEFAARAAPVLREYSDRTHHEACGVIATDGETFGVRIGTSGSHIGCVSRHDDVPAGMKSTGVTIHSHGTDRAFNVNRADKLFIPETHHGRRRIEGQVLDQFSAQDYLEPGYLATPTGAIYQPGT